MTCSGGFGTTEYCRPRFFRSSMNSAAREAQPKTAANAFVSAANTAAAGIQLDEAETRRLIDSQLRQAGWTVDTELLRHSRGTRPEKGKNMAIAEWPTATGPADYVLFAGLTPLAAVEAKRKNINVSSALQQAKRYSRGFIPSDETVMHPQNWGAESEYRLPFIFSSNGRPFLRQLSTHSGIWFCDLRSPDNLGARSRAGIHRKVWPRG